MLDGTNHITMPGMGQFSLKRMFASITLVAVGFWMALQIDRGYPWFDTTCWLGIGPVFGLAFYIVFGGLVRSFVVGCAVTGVVSWLIFMRG